MNSNLSKATKKFTIKKPYFFNIKLSLKIMAKSMSILLRMHLLHIIRSL